MPVKIALAGNPNSGKTTMFNELTGSSQYVGNWPGVTVERKEGRLKGAKDKDVIIQDLPGIYSLSPYTLEEVVARNYLVLEKPDAILNIVDGSNIERNLYLTTQLIELGLPVVIALNMMDVVRKNGDAIDMKKLGEALGCEIVATSALKGEGCMEAAARAVEAAMRKVKAKPAHIFGETVERAIVQIEDLIRNSVDVGQLRWFALKLFERDEKVMEQLAIPDDVKEKIESAIRSCEEKLDDDSESIVTNERYMYISRIIAYCVRKKHRKDNLTMSDKIDGVVTNRFLALPIFGIVMFLVYYASVSTVGSWATDWVNDSFFGEMIPLAAKSWLVSVNTADWLILLILNGIIGGIGAVLGFLPQMLVLFFLLAILEDCGYMARIAFIMDRIFRKFGLSGKSFIPILVGSGCGVPGVMASRTIENDRDRRMTIMTTTFIPCGAKLPIIALVAGAMFDGAWWVAPSAYFAGITAIVLSGIMLKKTRLFAGDPAPFVMELPPYRLPGIKGLLIHTWDRGKSFVRKAGTIIFLACGFVWFMSSFNWSLEMVDPGESILASLGNAIAPIFSPLGWGDWKATVAVLTGLIAKENIVGTLGVLYGAGEVAENGAEIWGSLRASYTPLSAYSFLIFNLLCAPCFAAIGAIRREMGSAGWTLTAVGYQTGLAYAVSFCIYQIGMWVSGNGLGIGTIAGFAVAAGILCLVFRPQRKKPLMSGKKAVARV